MEHPHKRFLWSLTFKVFGLSKEKLKIKCDVAKISVNRRKTQNYKPFIRTAT